MLSSLNTKYFSDFLIVKCFPYYYKANPKHLIMQLFIMKQYVQKYFISLYDSIKTFNICIINGYI